MQQVTIILDDHSQANHDRHPVKDRVKADRQPEGSRQQTSEHQEDVQQQDKEEEQESWHIESDTAKQVEYAEDHSRHQGCHPDGSAFAQVLEEVAPHGDFFAHAERQAYEQAIEEESQSACSSLGSNDLDPPNS